MVSSTFLGITTVIYLVCMALYFCFNFFKNRKFGQAITAVVVLGLLANTIGLGLRWYESYQLGHGHIPLSNMYESLVSLSWTTVIFYLWIEFRYKTKALGVMVFPLVSIAMAFASLSPNIADGIEPLVPALQSNWLTYHVITCFLAYSAFAVSFGASIMYLVKARKAGAQAGAVSEQEELALSHKMLDEVIYKTVAIGFLLLSVGIITGAVWANYAWGSYWTWDPKETWSLITWFVYAAFIHARMTRGWQGKRLALLSIIGFGSVLFTFLGVNYILSGLHSYT
ncbi:MAG: c-type cytochrome biogenesis protein CcsB [Deltaproteobacteria bacterium]|nr:c-type cytochrome biogenesis protein CcsB [Deltaproteobacteria bacterium]